MMTRDDIFRVLKMAIREVLFELSDEQIVTSASLRELGANSIDRAEIVVQTIAQLKLKMSLVEFASARNIGELVDVLYSRQEAAGSLG